MSAVMQEKNQQVFRWVTFRLADEIYGINVMQVQEVLRMTDVAPVPGAPHFVMGIMIIESGKVTVGLLVDSVAEVVNIASSDIDPPPSVGNDEGSRYIQGIYSTEQQILILIDLNKLINEENRDAIGMF